MKRNPSIDFVNVLLFSLSNRLQHIFHFSAAQRRDGCFFKLEFAVEDELNGLDIFLLDTTKHTMHGLPILSSVLFNIILLVISVASLIWLNAYHMGLTTFCCH